MANAYKVIGQRETTQITPDGRFQDGVQVTIQTASGAVLSAFIAADLYEPEHVRSVLEDLAETANTIHQL